MTTLTTKSIPVREESAKTDGDNRRFLQTDRPETAPHGDDRAGCISPVLGDDVSEASLPRRQWIAERIRWLEENLQLAYIEELEEELRSSTPVLFAP